MKAGDKLINDLLGEGFFEELKKSNELFKLNSQMVLNPEEMKIGLKIVPRAVMSFLIGKLVHMPVGSQEVVQLPFGDNAHMNVNKGDTDSYSGSIISGGKPVYDFRGRSIPGIGIILLSTFELYDLKQLEEEPEKSEPKYEPSIEERVQKIIEEKLQERELIAKVVDQQISQREAVQKLLMAKLNAEMKAAQPTMVSIPEVAPAPVPSAPIDIAPKDIQKKEDAPKKGSPLKAFLDRKKPKKEFAVKMEKSDTVDCPDCGQKIFDNSGYSGCVCMGENMNSKIWIKKSEDGIKISFSRQWEPENIEMLLQVLRRQHG